MVSAGHSAAALGGAEVLRRGGNAIDAGVAAGICLNVLQPDMTNFGGVAPILVFLADTKQVHGISGLGWWPRNASIEHFQRHHDGQMPPGVLRAVIPSAPDAWLTALERFGTLRFEEVVTPALELAEHGFPVYPQLEGSLRTLSGVFQQWPSSMEVYAPNGRTPRTGELLVQRDLARTFQRLIEAERGASDQGREAGIRAARERFYRGDLAQEMARFSREQGGWLDEQDLADFRVEVEAPPSIDYKGIQVYGSGAWCQGPLLLESLKLLEGIDLQRLGHNSLEYVHTVAEALLLGFADREAYIGDPRFVEVPLEGLLSAAYAQAQRGRIGPRAAGRLPEPGDPWPFQGRSAPARHAAAPQPVAGRHRGDTSYLCVIDAQGNGFSATPSDTLDWTPIVPGLGIVLSGRGLQSRLDPAHPSALAPGKRPRLTPNPALAVKDGELFMTFGTPGGDMQVQAMLQTFLNVVEFGMDPQQAIESPRFGTFSYPNSFYPYAYTPGLLRVEDGIAAQTRQALGERGHQVQTWTGLDPEAGGVTAIVRERYPGGSSLAGGADPRRTCYAIGW